jgi:hypothetical protein
VELELLVLCSLVQAEGITVYPKKQVKRLEPGSGQKVKVLHRPAE